MLGLLQNLPWLITMVVLVGCSGFFSASEAALFYLRREDRRALAIGSPSQRVAERLGLPLIGWMWSLFEQ